MLVYVWVAALWFGWQSGSVSSFRTQPTVKTMKVEDTEVSNVTVGYNVAAGGRPWPYTLVLERTWKKVGEGSFSTASLHSLTAPCEGEVVIKKLKCGMYGKDPAVERSYFHAEVDIMEELQDPNIVRMYDYWPRDDELWCQQSGHHPLLVMEPAYGGEMNSSLTKYRSKTLWNIFGFDKEDRRDKKIKIVLMVLVDALRGLTYMHGKGYIHRDIKPANIWEATDSVECVESGTCEFLIGDLGMATKQRDAKVAHAGTKLFRPLQDDVWTEQGDIFSLGISMALAVLHKKAEDFVENTKADSEQYATLFKEFGAKDYLPADLKSFLLSMLKYGNHLERPTAADALTQAEAIYLKEFGHTKPQRARQGLPCLDACKACVSDENPLCTPSGECIDAVQ